MNRTTYKIIAFDLDGTLLRDDKSIPPENLLALREAAARGIEPVVATGRIFRGIPEQLKELPFLHYYILSNGAAVYDSRADRTLFRADIPLALALSCYEYLDTLPVIYDCYQNEQGWMSRAMLERAAPYFEREPEVLKLLYGLRKPVDDLKQTLRERGEGLQKLQMFFKPEDEALRQATIRELPGVSRRSWPPPRSKTTSRSTASTPARARRCWRSAGRWGWRPPPPSPSGTAATTSKCCARPGSAWPWPTRTKRSRPRRTA